MQGIYKYVKRGRLHEQEQLACQDVVTGAIRKGIVVITGADGSSGTDFGRQGAQIAAEVLKNMLLECFDELYVMEKRDLQYNLIIHVRQKLYELCEKNNICLEDVKSTLMAFAYDKNTHRVIMVHLGDGYIVVKRNEQYRIVSYPENAGNRYCTFMTCNIPIANKIKVYRGEMDDLERAYLLTDGWCEFIKRDEEILQLIRLEINRKCQLAGEDDLAMICMNLSD